MNGPAPPGDKSCLLRKNGSDDITAGVNGAQGHGNHNLPPPYFSFQIFQFYIFRVEFVSSFKGQLPVFIGTFASSFTP